jgi:hypothetical protein
MLFRAPAFLLLALWLAALTASPTLADERPAVSLGIGTLGISLGGAMPVSPRNDVRLDLSSGSASWQNFTDAKLIDVTVHVKDSESGHLAAIRASYGTALGADHVRLVTGLMWHRTAINGLVVNNESSLTINGTQYSAAQLGPLGANLRWIGFSPYVGFASGRGGEFARRPKIEWEIGGFYEGRPQVELLPGPFISANPNIFGKYLDAFAVEFWRRHTVFQFYPVAQLRFRVR